MAEGQHGLLDGPGAFDEPYDPTKAFDRSEEVDLGAYVVAKAKEDALRERQAQDEAEAMSLCQGIDNVVLPYLREEHCTAGVTTPSGHISRLTNDDWATFEKARAFCAEYGANVDRGRWPISPQGLVAFLVEQSKGGNADHVRKCYRSISKVTRSLLDPCEEPTVRATLARLCDDGPDEDKKSDNEKGSNNG
jgi:hypothetical protein